jgi:hypothetical protein
MTKSIRFARREEVLKGKPEAPEGSEKKKIYKRLQFDMLRANADYDGPLSPIIRGHKNETDNG